MSLISLKRSSRHKTNMNIGWEMAFLLGAVEIRWYNYGLGPFVITSCKDGKHRPRSFHRQDRPNNIPSDATDIRTRHLFKKGSYNRNLIFLIQDLQKVYGKHGLRIFLHGYHDKGVPHLHLAYDEKKGKLWRWVR